LREANPNNPGQGLAGIGREKKKPGHCPWDGSWRLVATTHWVLEVKRLKKKKKEAGRKVKVNYRGS